MDCDANESSSHTLIKLPVSLFRSVGCSAMTASEPPSISAVSRRIDVDLRLAQLREQNNLPTPLVPLAPPRCCSTNEICCDLRGSTGCVVAGEANRLCDGVFGFVLPEQELDTDFLSKGHSSLAANLLAGANGGLPCCLLLVGEVTLGGSTEVEGADNADADDMDTGEITELLRD